MIRLIIFDCDGVLVDSEPISNRLWAEELTRIGLPTTYEDSIHHYMGKSAADNLELIKKQLGRNPPHDFLQLCQQKSRAAFKRELKPVAGINEALEEIAIDTCVASSGSHEKIRFTLGLTALLPHFEGKIFSASDVDRGKPYPDLFLHAAKSIGHPPQDCVVVEDSLPGVKAAVAAGMKVLGYVALSSAADLSEAGAAVFSDMRQLPNLVAELDSDS